MPFIHPPRWSIAAICELTRGSALLPPSVCMCVSIHSLVLFCFFYAGILAFLCVNTHCLFSYKCVALDHRSHAVSFCSSAGALVWFVCVNVSTSQFLCFWGSLYTFQIGLRSQNMLSTFGEPSSHCIQNQILLRGLFMLQPPKPPRLRPKLDIYSMLQQMSLGWNWKCQMTGNNLSMFLRGYYDKDFCN